MTEHAMPDDWGCGPDHQYASEERANDIAACMRVNFSHLDILDVRHAWGTRWVEYWWIDAR